jgi:uncharacterized protein
MAVQRVPAIDGWFTMDEAAPALIGARGDESGSYYWPPSLAVSANPRAPFESRSEVHLSRTGTLWSWATNHYQPPEPFIPNGPDGAFEPYTVCAVELAEERMVVLGPLATGADPEHLTVGMAMELVLGPLFTDADAEHVVWQWAPASQGTSK